MENNNELEKEFEQLCNEFEEKAKNFKANVDKLLNGARGYLDQAVELSKKEGIPFNSYISPLSNTFVPKSFYDSKFKDLDKGIIEDITGVCIDQYSPYGWEHSAIC